MIRMADIIKIAEARDPKEIPALTAPPEEPRVPQSPIDSMEEKVTQDREKARALYNEGVSLIKDVYSKTRDKKTVDGKEISDFANRFVDQVILDDGELFDCFYEESKEKNYLFNHSVNVCLLTLKIAQWLNLNKSDLVDLGIAGLLHDIGMAEMEPIMLKPKKLNMRERIKVNKHAQCSSKIINEVTNLKKEFIIAVKYHHRKSMRNRFSMVKEKDIPVIEKFSQVIALADMYEAATHSRVYKDARLPHEAIKEIIENEDALFEQGVITTLVKHIGIYPVGSWVILSTGEIGIVMSINSNYPLRPKVNVMFDSKQNNLEKNKILDLTEDPHLYIDSPIDISKRFELKERLNIQ